MKNSFNEVLLHVYWTKHTSDDGDRSGHLSMRGKVSADLGLETSPDFTAAEMEQITFAAKMQALKCLRARKLQQSRRPCHKGCPPEGPCKNAPPKGKRS